MACLNKRLGAPAGPGVLARRCSMFNKNPAPYGWGAVLLPSLIELGWSDQTNPVQFCRRKSSKLNCQLNLVFR